MEVTFWGVRGSYPVPGPDTVRYGGHTSCVEVRSASGQCVVIDAGTGLRALGKKLSKEQRLKGHSKHHIVLSHVHWDHIQGLPFFEPAYIEDTEIHIYGLRQATEELRQVVGGITRQEFFPVPLEAVPANFSFNEVAAGSGFEIGDLKVTPFHLNHPFGCVGYKVADGQSSVAYVADTAPFDRMLHKQHFLAGPESPSEKDKKALHKMREDLRTAIRGTHTVIYDTHFSVEEYEKFPHYGHSTPEHALELVADLDVSRLVLYHHSPTHDDDTMDKIETLYQERGAKKDIQVIAARELMALRIGGETP